MVLLAGALLVAFGQASYEPEARAFLDQFVAQKFEDAVKRFDGTMAKALPPAKLAETWQALTTQVGKLKEVKSVQHVEQGGLHAVILTSQFEQALLNVRVVFGADGRITGLFFAPAQSPAANWTPAPAVKRESFDEREVTVGGAPWTMPGTLTVPNGPGPFAVVVLVHGSGPNDADETIGANKVFKDMAWGLATRGVAALRYTKRTRQYGAKLNSISNFTVRDETVDDAVMAADLLASQPGIDPRRIFIVGHSLGALLAPRIAAANPRVAGIVLMAGNSRPLEELIIEQVEYLSRADGVVTEAEQTQMDAAKRAVAEIRDPNLKPDQIVTLFGSKVPGSYFIDLRDYRPMETATKLKIPILVLQGERDYQVRMADFEGWKRGLAGHANATCKSYPALTHLFIASGDPAAGLSTPQEYAKPGHVAEEVLDDIAAWIRKPVAK